MKPQDLRRYAKTVSDVIDSTQDNGTDLNGDYEALRKAIDSNSVSELGAEKLSEIKAHFQSGTDKYQDNVNKLEQAPVPVKVLGRHKMLIRAYEDYAQACQAMTDSVEPDAGTVNTVQFNQAEKDQESSIEKVSNATTRIMSMLS